MKIAIDMTGTNFMSGTKTYNLNFCEHLTKTKIKQEIFIFICKNYKKYLPNPNNKNIKYIVKPNILSITWIRMIWMQFLFPFELMNLDINKLYSPMNFVPIFIRIFRIKSVLTIHSNLPWVNFSKMPGNYFRKFIIKNLMRISVFICDDLIVNSFFAKKELIKFLKLKRKKIHVIYLGVDKKYKEKKKNKNFVKNFNYKRYILSVLSCVRYHNILNLIKAFEMLKKQNKIDLRLVLVLQILDKKYFLEIKEYINENNLEKQILIYHDLETKYLVNLYKYSSLYAFTSYNEVFGLTSLEAMSQSCPVIISRKSALEEINGKAAKYFNPDNINNISKVMHRALFQKNLRNILKKRGKSHIKKFDWNKTVNKTIEVVLG